MKKITSILLAAIFMAMPMMFVSCGGGNEAGGNSDKSYDVEFVFSDAVAKAGETVDVEINMSSTAEANAYMLYELTYDSDILEFVELTNLGDAGEQSIFGELGLDQDKITVSIALMNSKMLNGKVCDVRFKVKDSAKAGESTAVSMSSVVKHNSDEKDSGVKAGSVTVAE